MSSEGWQETPKSVTLNQPGEAAMRSRLPDGAIVEDYVFREGPIDLTSDRDARDIRLRELFADRRQLIVYHLMFHPDDDEACPMCSSIVDGLHGISHHLHQ